MLKKNVFASARYKFTEFIKEENIGSIALNMCTDFCACKDITEVMCKTSVVNHSAETGNLFIIGRIFGYNICRIDFGMLFCYVLKKMVSVISGIGTSFRHYPKVGIFFPELNKNRRSFCGCQHTKKTYKLQYSFKFIHTNTPIE